MITLIAKFLAALNANSRPGEAASGFACGILLALVPADNLLWILLFTVFFFLRLHLATMILTTVIFKLFIGAADPLLDTLGLWILQMPQLEPFFTQAINTPILPFLKFNNTLVSGGLAAGILLWAPAFLTGRLLVILYRRSIRDRLASSKLVKFFEKTPLLRKLTMAVRKAGTVYQGWNG